MQDAENQNEQIIIDENGISTKQSHVKLSKPAIAGIVYLICCACFLLAKFLKLYNILQFNSVILQELIPSTIVQAIIMFSIPVVLFSLLNKQKIKTTFKEFKFKKISLKSILYSIIIGIGVAVLLSFLSSFFTKIITILGAESLTYQTVNLAEYTVPMFFVVIFTSCILPAICEETVHRGMLLGAYSKYGTTFAIVITSVVFGLLHMNIFQCFYAFCVGMFLAYICLYTRSIIPGIIIHFINNFANTLWDFSYVNNWLGGGLYAWQNTIIKDMGSDIYYLLSVMAFIIALIVVVYFAYKLIKKERLNEILNNVPPDVESEYESIKNSTVYELYAKRAFMPQTIQDFYFEKLKQTAKMRKITLLEYFENGGTTLKHRWYDNIFIYTSLVLAAYYTLYSFLYLVV